MASSAATDKEEIASTYKEAQADAPAEIVAVDFPAPTGCTKKENYISKEVWDGKEPEIARCIPWDPKNDSWTLNTRMRQYIRITGLHNISEIKKWKIDHALISGLIERWRPETNTFHFLGDEATVTLEDVAYIYGLPIDEPAVTGRVWSYWMILEEKFLDLLGVTSNPSEFQGGQINFKWFHDNFKDLSKRPSQAVEIRHTREYPFHLVSSQICTNTSGSRGNVYLIEFFEDFKPYACGPTCLANLYRSLGACLPNQEWLFIGVCCYKIGI